MEKEIRKDLVNPGEFLRNHEFAQKEIRRTGNIIVFIIKPVRLIVDDGKLREEQ